MTARELQELAYHCGIEEVCAVAAGPAPVNREDFTNAVALAPAELGYLSRTLERRLDPRLAMPGARTVVVGIVPYGQGPARPDPLPPGTGWISRYAMGPDYHDVAGRRFAALATELESVHRASSKWYVDTGPVTEKAWAVAGGLGFQGRNTLLVSPGAGSFVFIGVVLTDLEIEASAPLPSAGGCAGCTACVDACPTGALDISGRLDRARCLAHLTVSSKEPIPPGINLAGNLFGCDICQDVCPFNPGRAPANRTESPFHPLPGLFCPSLSDILNMDETAFARVFSTSPVFRRGLQAVQNTARRLLDTGAAD